MAIPRPVVVIGAILSLCPGAGIAQQQGGAPYDPQIHWAYSSFLGTGWYKISDERDGFVFRVRPRWKIGEADFDDEGKRKIEYTFRLPLTIGLTRLDFDDIPGTLDPANIPISDTFFVRPLSQVGYGTVLDDDESAITYFAGVRFRKEFPRENFDWALMGGVGYAGYTPNEGRADDFIHVNLAAEFSHPLSWQISPDAQTLFHWYVGYTDLIDEIKFDFRPDQVQSIGNYWQVGFAIGLREQQIKAWRFSFDRLGLTYSYSRQGEHRGIGIQFRSLYDF